MSLQKEPKKEPKSKKHVVLGVTASIAAYKAAEIASLLVKEGILVDVVFTEETSKFIAPLTFSAITHRPVLTSFWEENTSIGCTHIEIADRANLLLIAPATADFIAQMAYGFAKEALGAIALATRALILIAPAMNCNMWSHPATQENVAKLKARGVQMIGPAQGSLACGYEGIGRLATPHDIVSETLKILS